MVRAMSPHLLFVALAAACGAPSSGDPPPPDAARDATTAPHPDAANCALSGTVTGSAASYTFGPITSAQYSPPIIQTKGGEPEVFSVGDAIGRIGLDYIGGYWTLVADGHDTYPSYFTFPKSFNAVRSAGCWTVTFEMTVDQCDNNGGNCTTPVGGFAGTIHVGH
jgi:hypothetical protein